MIAKAPSFQWYPKDCDTDENVRAMDDREFGFYMRCLNHAWLNNGVPGELPRLAAVMGRTPSYVRKIWPSISPCFELREGRYFNKKQEENRENVRDFLRKKSAAATSRWDKPLIPKNGTHADAMQMQCPASPTASPTAITYTGGRYEDRATPEQIALREALERMYNLHPKKKDFGGVLGALGRASSNGTTLGQIEERHAAWCRHGEWIAADKQKYVPTLTKWLEDRGFTQWPPGHQKAEQPKRYICPEAEPEP